MEDLSKELTLEMFPEGLYKDIAEAIGVQNFYKLSKVVGGATVYLPKPESVVRPVRDARIKAEVTGYTRGRGRLSCTVAGYFPCHNPEEVIAAAGGKPMMSRVGHSFIKEQMRQNDAIFAGELSGHYYFKANFTAESSSMATFALANIVSKSDKPLSALVAPLRKYAHSGEINSKVADAAAVLARVKATFPDNFELDGVSVDNWSRDGWWCNVRMSNTEPLVRLNLEAKTPDLMAAKRDELLALIRA